MKQPWTDADIAKARDLIAAGNSARQVGDALGRSRRSIVEAVARMNLGDWKSRPGRAVPPVPEGFAEYLADHTYKDTAAHFGCGISNVQRWANRLGINRTQVSTGAKPAATPKTAPARPAQFVRQSFTSPHRVEGYQRDMSEAGQAADFMRRDRRVFRCDLNGNQDSKGRYWMCGIVWMTDAELIERATAKGFRAVRWAA